MIFRFARLRQSAIPVLPLAVARAARCFDTGVENFSSLWCEGAGGRARETGLREILSRKTLAKRYYQSWPRPQADLFSREGATSLRPCALGSISISVNAGATPIPGSTAKQG